MTQLLLSILDRQATRVGAELNMRPTAMELSGDGWKVTAGAVGIELAAGEAESMRAARNMGLPTRNDPSFPRGALSIAAEWAF